MLLIFKNVFSFALTYKAYDWLIEGGIVPVFNALGSVQLVICLASIPMCKSIHKAIRLGMIWCFMVEC